MLTKKIEYDYASVLGESDNSLVRMELQQTDTPYEYHHGTTGTRFSVQIGRSTNYEKYVWMIIHEDFNYCVFGGETTSIEEAKNQSTVWLDNNTKFKDDSPA